MPTALRSFPEDIRTQLTVIMIVLLTFLNTLRSRQC